MRAARPLALVLGLAPILLGYAAWRVERDHPALLAFRLADPAVAVLAGSAVPRLVLAVHYPWYGTPEGPTGRWRHWNHVRLALPEGRVLGFHDPRILLDPDRRDLGAAHYPLGGPYDSADPTVMRAQIAAAAAAGLDGFVVSWWGRESEEARAFGALLAVAGAGGFRLAPYYEAGELWPRGGPGVAADLEALLDRHGREPAWLRIDGRPVVFVYGSHRVRPPVWEYVRRRLRGGGRDVFLVGDALRPGWIERFDALHVYTPVPLLAGRRDLAVAYREWSAITGAAGRPFIAPVTPGYDDRPIRVPGTLVERADGATYAATWQAALAADPAGVLVASWNEWHEGTEIEPSREHGKQYLDATRQWADQFHALPLRP